MSPRRASPKKKDTKKTAVKAGPSKDRERHLEDARHHPAENPLPHREHKTIPKPALPSRHTPHSHLHGDELPAHTNPPSQIKPSKKVTKPGALK
jgi:hypothetical protein